MPARGTFFLVGDFLDILLHFIYYINNVFAIRRERSVCYE